MSSFIESMIARACRCIHRLAGRQRRTHPRRRRKVLERGIARVVILATLPASKRPPTSSTATIVDPATSPDRERYAQAFYELRKHKGVTIEDARAKMDDVVYFGTMMVKLGDADGMTCGCCHATADVLRAALQILKTAPGVKSVSSFFVMAVPDCDFGDKGVFLFADCGLEIQPDAEKLANIAVSTGKSWKMLFDSEPAIAMLSHSTKGSAVANADRDKVIEATKLAREAAPELTIDGELQADAAIVPAVGASKSLVRRSPGAPTCSSFP